MTNADVNSKLQLAAPIIQSVAQSFFGCDCDDHAQDCAVYVWQHVLPQYDESRKTPFSAYARVAVRNWMKSRWRQIRKERGRFEQMPDDMVAATDTPHVERLAHDITTSPEKYLPAREAELMRHYTPGMTTREVAQVLGTSRMTACRTLTSTRESVRKLGSEQ